MYVKSEFKAVLLKLTALFIVIIASCDAQNLSYWSYIMPLPPHV